MRSVRVMYIQLYLGIDIQWHPFCLYFKAYKSWCVIFWVLPPIILRNSSNIWLQSFSKSNYLKTVQDNQLLLGTCTHRRLFCLYCKVYNSVCITFWVISLFMFRYSLNIRFKFFKVQFLEHIQRLLSVTLHKYSLAPCLYVNTAPRPPSPF